MIFVYFPPSPLRFHFACNMHYTVKCRSALKRQYRIGAYVLAFEEQNTFINCWPIETKISVCILGEYAELRKQHEHFFDQNKDYRHPYLKVRYVKKHLTHLSL